MRAKLSAVSNFTTPQLLTILQNWITNTSKIIVDGQVLRVTSVYFLSNDITPVPASGSPNLKGNNETNTKNKEIVFSAIGSAGGLSLFICICCIITSVSICQKFKSKINDHLKPRFVLCIIENIIINDVIIMHYRENEMKERKDDDKHHFYSQSERTPNNKLDLLRNKISISPNR